MKCTSCGRDVAKDQGQDYCPFCGSRLEQSQGTEREDFADRTQEHEHPETNFKRPFGEEPDGYCAWEDQERLGFVRGIGVTLRESLFSPQNFFDRIPRRGGYLNPLLFALIVETLGALLSSLWGLLFGHPLFVAARLSGNLTLIGGVLIPLLVFVQIIASAVLLHASLLLVRGAREDFETTFRVVCYTAGAELFNLIPLVGGMIGLGWKIYLTFVGIRATHRITARKTVMALVLPLALLICIALIGVLAMTSMGLALTED